MLTKDNKIDDHLKLAFELAGDNLATIEKNIGLAIKELASEPGLATPMHAIEGWAAMVQDVCFPRCSEAMVAHAMKQVLTIARAIEKPLPQWEARVSVRMSGLGVSVCWLLLLLLPLLHQKVWLLHLLTLPLQLEVPCWQLRLLQLQHSKCRA